MRYISKRSESSALYEQSPVNNTFIYVHLFKTLALIFKNAEVSCHTNKPPTVCVRIFVITDVTDINHYSQMAQFKVYDDD